MDFEIVWDGDEASRFWFWDESHWPRPTVPLAATLELPAIAEGFTRACRELQRPFPAYHVKVVHGFVYFGFDLVTDPAERAERARVAAKTLEPRIGDVQRFWTDDVLPPVIAANDRLRFGDWDALSGAELATALDELYAIRARQWELHDLVLVPAMAAHAAFLDMYARLFPEAPPAEAHALLRGLPNKTVESARALWRLAHEPAVARLLAEQWPERQAEAEAALQRSPLVQAYLDEFGWRTDGWELSDPALREDPRPLLARLRSYAAGAHPDPEPQLRHAAEERERLTAAAFARLPDDGARREFLASLGAARTYPVLSEDHNFYIDQMGLTALRVPLLAMGHRLVEHGLLTDPADVFYLTREELRENLPPLPPSLKGRGSSSEVTAPDVPPPPHAERSSSFERSSRILPSPLGEGLGERSAARRAARRRMWNERPPATIGTPLPDDMKDDPLYAGFFGVGAEPPAGQRVLRGAAGAPGVVSGQARVVRSLADSDRLEPGDILVCPMTSPAWTPLFATIAAVVADAGGTLSHTAIVAREYGIPCVVGTRVACREIADGEWIEVDGSAGEVRRM